MARPAKWKLIDQQKLAKLAEKHWTDTEIAAFFKVSPDLIRRRFSDLIEESRQNGKAKLRDIQWARALKGSDRIIIHMSRHYLGQHDTLKQEITGAAGGPIEQRTSTMPADDLNAIREKLKSDI